MTERTLLTNSEIKTFKRCRRKWWLANYRGLRPIRETKHGAAAKGTRVHEALDLLYTVDAEAALADLRAKIEADVTEFPEQADEIVKDGDMAIAMVEGYIEWLEETGEDEDIEFIAAEARVEADLGYMNVTLLGKLDQRVRRISTGERLFLDHKTVDDFSRVRLLRLDEQMKHYHLIEILQLVELGIPVEEERTGGALYNMLRKVKRTARAKPPFYMREEVRHNIEEMRDYYRRVCHEAAEIVVTRQMLDNGFDPSRAAYPNPTRDCGWDCPFLAVCPMFDDGSDAEAMVEQIYEVGDHLDRYDERSSI